MVTWKAGWCASRDTGRYMVLGTCLCEPIGGYVVLDTCLSEPIRTWLMPLVGIWCWVHLGVNQSAQGGWRAQYHIGHLCHHLFPSTHFRRGRPWSQGTLKQIPAVPSYAKEHFPRSYCRCTWHQTGVFIVESVWLLPELALQKGTHLSVYKLQPVSGNPVSDMRIDDWLCTGKLAVGQTGIRWVAPVNMLY